MQEGERLCLLSHKFVLLIFHLCRHIDLLGVLLEVSVYTDQPIHQLLIQLLRPLDLHLYTCAAHFLDRVQVFLFLADHLFRVLYRL